VTKKLENGYEIRVLETKEFGTLWEKHAKEFFDDSQQIFRVRDSLSSPELEKMKLLREQMGTPFRVNLGLYHKDDFVGWSWGFQEYGLVFLSSNRAIQGF